MPSVDSRPPSARPACKALAIAALLAVALPCSLHATESIENTILADEASRLLAVPTQQTATEAPQPPAAEGWTLRIEGVDLPQTDTPVDFSKWSDAITSLRMEGPHVTRRGEPVFLAGLEAHLAYPWLFKLLGADFIHTQDTAALGTLTTRKDEDSRTFIASYDYYPLLGAQIPRYLDHGLAIWVQPFEEKRDGTMSRNHRVFPFFTELPHLYVNNSHFMNFRFEEPQGNALRENMWKSFIRTTRQYPIFAYELFNEARYMDYSPANLDGFRRAMEHKYHTINAANTTWGTDFTAFDKVDPPQKSSSYGGSTLMGLTPKKFSRPLWVDWQKYIEDVFAHHVADLSAFVKETDTNPGGYTTVQSVFDLGQDYSGGGGTHPRKILASTDFLSAETGGGAYIAQDGGDDYDEIKVMLQPLMLNDLVVSLSPDAPVIDVEINLIGYGRSPTPETAPYNLAGSWHFSPETREAGLAAGFEKNDFDDSNWGQITVPGLWGNQGYPEASHGWYRKDITFPAGSVEPGTRLYLNGSKLTDRAQLYVNGRRVHQTRDWRDRFGIDVTSDLYLDGRPNTIAVSIANTYYDNNMYWGGIRDFLVIDTRSYNSAQPLRPGQMRSFWWTKIAHGKSGAVPSYAYPAEGDRLSMFNPSKVSWQATAAMPATLREIANVSDIILADNRAPAQIALAYSFESGRGRVARNYEDWLSAYATKDILDYYAALLFGGVARPAIIDAETLAATTINDYQALFLRMNERIPADALARMEDYVRNGGVLVIDHGSLTTDDDTHSPLDISDLAGVQIHTPRTTASAPLAASPWWPDGTATRARKHDGQSGRHLTLKGATALANYKDGSPAVTRHTLGKGTVYYIAAELPETALRPLLSDILTTHHIRDNDIQIVPTTPNDTRGRFIEARLFTHNDARLAYLHNWGDGPVPMTLRLPTLPEGNWRVRKLDLDNTDTEGQLYTAAELHRGIPLQIPGQDPVPLLIEPATAPARPLPGLTPEHREYLSLLGPGPRGGTRVLINAGRAETMSKVRMLTAARLLGEKGFEVNTGLGELLPTVNTFTDEITTEDLSSYNVLLTLGSGPGDKNCSEEQLAALRDFVVNGGGLLIAANEHVGPHWWFGNSASKQSLASIFGVGTTETNIHDESHSRPGTPSHPQLLANPQFAEHPILTSVSRIQTLGSSVLKPDNPAAKALLLSTSEAQPANAPAAAALEFGKGRVVILGDAKWLQPDAFAEADNAQFFLNILQWLAHQEADIAPLASEEKAHLTRHAFAFPR